MKNESHQIDEFYREVLKDNTQKASAFIWARMRWRLFWMSNYRYVLGIGAATAILVAVYFLTGTGNNDLQNSANEQLLTVPATVTGQVEKETSVSNTIEKETSISAISSDSKNISTGGTKSNSAGATNTNTKNNTELLTSEVSASKNPAVSENNLFSSSPKISKKPDEFPLTAMTEILNRPGIFTIERKDLTIHPLVGQSLRFAATDTGLITKIPYDIKLKKNWVSIGLYVATAYTVSTLKADDGYQDYLKYRKDHESPAISVCGGLNVRVNIGNGFIQTGLEYSEYRQYRNYNNSFQAFDSLNSYYRTDTIWGWVFDPPDVGKPIILGYDTVFVPVYNTTNEGYNRWQYLEIPLIGGYRFNKGRVGFEAATGFSCSFLLDAGGNVPHLTDKNRFTELSDLKDEMNKYLFNYILQLGFTYHITPAWSFNIFPFYKQNLNSVFKNNYPVDQKFRSFGINFGLKVDL